MKPKVIAIVGPTASGKTGLGIEIAKKWDGEVISVDSRQIYRGMDIGTAKPEGEWSEADIEKGGSINQLFGARKTFEVEGVPHWGIDLVDPDASYSVADFKLFAEEKIADIVKRRKVPILVGGTGFWLKAVIDNLDLTQTPADPILRAELEARTLGDLFHEYKQLDPGGAELIDKQNKRRVLRALEVTKLTGKPFSEQQTMGEALYSVLQIGLRVPREVLNERIDTRVEEMVARGLVQEVRGLCERYGCEIESMTSIGYRQICQFVSGAQKLKEAIEEVKIDTRQYAKRQMTWFKRDERIHWVEPGQSVDAVVQPFLLKNSIT
ncbi:tRNA (adenosine(37)-N6)-dimethylallyltransferase MiaA [Candidatus Uhrbacteria bacterium]|nr:tRNA (adenosine(37)-N6)-dimethylallyltransferase MiaA [Candidatus Uhrbacteria bacterium]